MFSIQKPLDLTHQSHHMLRNEALTRLKRAIDGSVSGTSDFDLNPEFRPPEGTKLRPAGVLVAFDLNADVPCLYLTKRSSSLKHHPGQIAFPGGKVDPADNGSTTAAALREAEEEISLPRDHVTVLGEMSQHQSVTNFRITPVIGIIERPFQPVAESGEVEEVFTVPMEHVLNPNNYIVCWRFWQGMKRCYYTVPYGPYYIWGATARMLRVLADRAA